MDNGAPVISFAVVTINCYRRNTTFFTFFDDPSFDNILQSSITKNSRDRSFCLEGYFMV